MAVNGYKGITLNSICNIKSECNEWRNAMFTANGEAGIIGGLNPADDVIIFNNTKCVMDTVNPMETAELYPIDFQMKQAAITRGNAGIWVDYLKDYWNKKYGMEDYVACSARPYFPASLLHIKSSGIIENYSRQTDFYTGEISCRCTLNGEPVSRKAFVSRADGVAVILTECGVKKDFTLYFEDFTDMFLDADPANKKFSSIKFPQTYAKYGAGQIEFYGKPPVSHIDDNPLNPVTSLSYSGFFTAVKIMCNGKCKAYDNRVEVSASKMLLLVKTDYRRTGIQSAEQAEALCAGAQTSLNVLAEGYKITPLYRTLLERHTKIHSRLMGSAQVRFSKGSGFAEADELRLKQKQAEDGAIIPEWLDLLYAHSRFVTVCSHGYSTARLGGIWVGNPLPAWSGDHTLNANTNAQICGLNTGNLPECTQSYINFLLDYAPDWLQNAKNIHGIQNAIKAPARTDGAGCGLFFSTPAGFPMVYWNAGAAWQILPAFEMWECYGDVEISLREDLNIDRLKDLLDLSVERCERLKKERVLNLANEILKPLITKLMNFWIGFADNRFYIDGNGEVHAGDGSVMGEDGKYIFAPAYSPENAPDEQELQPVCANAAMDIAAARDSIRMFYALAGRGIITDYDFGAVKYFESHLPSYLTEADGSLKEWALPHVHNRNNHRHSSHLYAAWPAYEAARCKPLAGNIKQAIKNRRTYAADQRTTGFGRMQLAAASARIGDKALFAKCLYDMVGADFEYDSLVTGHDLGRAPHSFCQDNAASIHGVINEALVYSDSNGIILLPANIWNYGEARGITARCGVRINKLKWRGGKVIAELEALSGNVAVNIEYGTVKKVLSLKKGEPQTVEFNGAK